jgi:hypothetical protein
MALIVRVSHGITVIIPAVRFCCVPRFAQTESFTDKDYGSSPPLRWHNLRLLLDAPGPRHPKPTVASAASLKLSAVVCGLSIMRVCYPRGPTCVTEANGN